MPLVEMQKIFLFAHRQEKDRVINLLRDLGTVELVDLKESNAWEKVESLLVPEQADEEVARLESRLGEVRYCLDFLQRYFPERKSFIQQFVGAKANLSSREYEQYISNHEKIKDIYRACRAIDENLNELRNEETRSRNMLLGLSPWADFSLPLEEVTDSKRVCMRLFTVPTENRPSLQDSLARTAPDHYLKLIFTDKDQSCLFLVFLTEDMEPVQETLKEAGVAEISFSGISGTTAEALEALNKKLAGIQDERDALVKKVEELLDHRLHLMAFFDYLEAERAQKEAVNNLARTETSFLMEGWIPASQVFNLEKALADKTETAILTAHDPGPEEKVPVLLQNRRYADPFEFVTKMYSTPGQHELDPTPLMAPFFFIFFGICLSDAGYGIVLSLIALFAFRKLKLEGAGRQLIKLLFLGGISALIFGALMGSWFGDLIGLEPLWFNPLDDPMGMLIFCFGLGIIHIFFGMGVAAYQSIKNGKILDAIFDQGFWFVFLIGLISLAFPQFSEIGKWVAIGGAAGLILTQGRKQKGIFKKFFGGLLSLYDVTGYLSDVLSYSRLFALGLATGVIASAINTMGGLLATSFIGIIIMIILLIGGHLFNLIINTLGSYVHTSRLQYIEFFGKFFEGGGRSFKPFGKTSKFVEIIEEREA